MPTVMIGLDGVRQLVQIVPDTNLSVSFDVVLYLYPDFFHEDGGI